MFVDIPCMDPMGPPWWLEKETFFKKGHRQLCSFRCNDFTKYSLDLLSRRSGKMPWFLLSSFFWSCVWNHHLVTFPLAIDAAPFHQPLRDTSSTHVGWSDMRRPDRQWQLWNSSLSAIQVQLGFEQRKAWGRHGRGKLQKNVWWEIKGGTPTDPPPKTQEIRPYEGIIVRHMYSQSDCITLFLKASFLAGGGNSRRFPMMAMLTSFWWHHDTHSPWAKPPQVEKSENVAWNWWIFFTKFPGGTFHPPGTCQPLPANRLGRLDLLFCL